MGICVKGDGEQAILEVSDTGAGMTDDVRQHCFEPFFSTRKEVGRGLGLSSVYGIIRRHDGEIEVRTEAGKGTTFTIRLPILTAQPEPPPAEAAPSVPASHQLNVLVVEDEPMVLGIETEYLLADGHTVDTAADGCEGLSKFRTGRYDLVLIDRAMPKVNGDQLTEAIKELDPKMPVILVTGFERGFEENENGHQTADLVLAKPFSRASLRKAIHSAVAV